MRINGQNTTHLIILFCIILLSCNNKDDNKQKYNREVDLSQKSNISNSLKGKITKVIALGSNTSSVFGTISQIEFTPNDIFIFDDYKTKSLLRFDKSGKFKNLIGVKGNGPGELGFPLSFAVDKKSKFVEIYDQIGKQIKIFDYNGKYISSVKVGFSIQNFAIIDQTKYVVFVGNFGKVYYKNQRIENQLVFFDTKQGVYKELFLIINTNGFYTLPLSGLLTNYKGDIIFRTHGDFNIYNITNGKSKKICFLNFGDTFLPKNIIEGNSDNYTQFHNFNAPKTGYVYWIHQFFELENFYYLGFAQSGKFFSCIIEKQSLNVIYRSPLTTLSNILIGSKNGSLVGVEKDHLVFSLSSDEYVKNRKGISNKLKQNQCSIPNRKISSEDNSLLFYISISN